MFTTRVDCLLNVLTTRFAWRDLEEVGVLLDAGGVEGVVLRAHRDDQLVVCQLEVGPELGACIPPQFRADISLHE